MFRILRIVFTVLSALCCAAVVFLGVFLGWIGALVGAGCALLFFGLVVVFRNLQDKREQADEPPPPPRGDFFHPLPKEKEKDDE